MNSTAMPAIFFGHGNPMNAITENPYARKWNAIGQSIPKPKAVLVVSAHWYIEYTGVTANVNPRTIHDFGGFPRELYEVNYPAPGDPQLAMRVQELLDPVTPVMLDESWGLDHGTWSVLTHVFPNADVPIVQLSIDETKPPQFHYELGKRLAPLRDEGVMVVASGNIVHNLHAFAWGRRQPEPFDWAARFDARVRELILGHDDAPLVDYESLGRDAMLSAPTPDHYLPLVYLLGVRRPDDAITFPIDGIDGGSVSMLSVQFSQAR
jgi:4,5-DOPA dioxygenase extradiol